MERKTAVVLRGKAFSFCAASSSMKNLLLKSPLMIFFRPLAVSEERTLKIACNLTPMMECDVFRSAIDLADSTSLGNADSSTTTSELSVAVRVSPRHSNCRTAEIDKRDVIR